MKAASLSQQQLKLEPLTRAGKWLLESGIQSPGGGVARFYRADLERHCAISTEITGYAASTFQYLYTATGDPAFQEHARRAAHFLARDAWDPDLQNMPFEHGPEAESMLYFFDCGIIVRGLLAVWRETREEFLLTRAVECGRAMLRDFATASEIHPILTLPAKTPLARDWRWSRNPGCYQLKAALAWRELAAITGDREFSRAYQQHLERSLDDCASFLPGNPTPQRVMDRLHAFSYFLESLLSHLDDDRCALAFADGIARVSSLLREISPVFARSDVYAQLLRVRLWGAGTLPLDTEAARHEAETLVTFQMTSDDPRIDGGFSFGTLDGQLIPHINPVSTAFAIQALHMWHARVLPPLGALI
jgi:hypothetical protein